MITVEYTRHGDAVNDFNLELTYQDFVERVKDNEVYFSFSTENIFTRIRLGIVKGEIDFPIMFAFYTKEENFEFSPNKYGAIVNWPKGFCDSVVRMCEEILILATKKRKVEKAANDLTLSEIFQFNKNRDK